MSPNIFLALSGKNSWFVNFKFCNQIHTSLYRSVSHYISLNCFFIVFYFVTWFENMVRLALIVSFFRTWLIITFPKAWWGIICITRTLGKGSINVVTTFRKWILKTLRRISIRSTRSYSLLCHVIPTMTWGSSITSSIGSFTCKTTTH
jgi:hypothetical protein